ncbi:MAG: bifunctional oligoribonuclease/PAP phosphatase NrnA [Butyrivibrio sp.]|nr:bifunctional oligoribonuclease/PAP phosphatase NrnA [Butyrivibrio sp.]
MESISKELEGAESVGITGHVRPDGDCTGATLALYNYIRENMPQIEADVYLEPIEEHFGFLAGAADIHHKADQKKRYDVFVVLDCGDVERVAPFAKGYIAKAGKTICIDHHMAGSDFASVSHIMPKVSSVCEVLYELLDGEKISRSVAECLYVGMIHDTGVFKYQSVTDRTMEIAGKLMNTGIDFTSIIDDTFFRKTYEQNRLLGRALLESKRLLDGRLVYSYVSSAVMGELGVCGRDTSGIIDQLRFTEGAEVAVLMYDLPDGSIKTSLRSVRNVNVNDVAGNFGGGGHMRAAGFISSEKPEKIIESVSAYVAMQL